MAGYIHVGIIPCLFVRWTLCGTPYGLDFACNKAGTCGVGLVNSRWCIIAWGLFDVFCLTSIGRVQWP